MKQWKEVKEKQITFLQFPAAFRLQLLVLLVLLSLKYRNTQRNRDTLSMQPASVAVVRVDSIPPTRKFKLIACNSVALSLQLQVPSLCILRGSFGLGIFPKGGMASEGSVARELRLTFPFAIWHKLKIKM